MLSAVARRGHDSLYSASVDEAEFFIPYWDFAWLDLLWLLWRLLFG